MNTQDNNDHIVSNESLQLGLVRVNLIQGDVLSCPTDIVVCPVDHNGTDKTGLYSVLNQQKAFGSNPFGRKKWVAIGECLMQPVSNFPFDNVILVVLYSNSIGNANRVAIQQGLVKSLTMADAEGAVAVSCPMLGHAKGNLDYGLLANVMIKGVYEFSKQSPKNVRRIMFFAYNTKAFMAAEAQIMELSHTLG